MVGRVFANAYKLRLYGLAGIGLLLTSVATAEEPIANIKKAMVEAIQSKVGKKKESRYFVTFFSYQDDLANPKASHTFATYVEVDPSGKQHTSTISWLPADYLKTRDLCVFKGALWPIPGLNECKPVPGKNFSLEETLDIAADAKAKVGMWGPYEIQRGLYDMSQDRIASLERRDLQYIADDREMRMKGEAVNCLHAVSDLGKTKISQGGFLNSEFGIWGFNGTKHIISHYIKNSNTWLVDSIDTNTFKQFSDKPSQKSKSNPLRTLPAHRY